MRLGVYKLAKDEMHLDLVCSFSAEYKGKEGTQMICELEARKDLYKSHFVGRNVSAFYDTYHANVEDDTVAWDDLHADFQYSQDYTPVVNLEDQDDPFFTSLSNEVGGENVSTMNQTGGSKQSKKITETSTKPVQMKRTRREPACTSMFRKFMSEQNATRKHALELLLELDTKDQVGKTNIDSVISVMNRMVEDKLIAEYDDLWCFGMTVLEDPVKREFFLNFSTDAGRDCIGCIDGTHIGACILENQQVRYIGRKWVPTFNVMANCDFDMCFTFISAGWEGSAHDTRVFLHALNTSSLNFLKSPRGKYYLMDKGYPDRNGYLDPYSKTRYHLSEFENEPPNNKQEAFNRKHSSFQSYIERSFGVLKKRWKILDMMFTVMEQNPNYIPQDELHDVRGHDTNNGDNSEGACNETKQIRNDIATLIWNARLNQIPEAVPVTTINIRLQALMMLGNHQSNLNESSEQELRIDMDEAENVGFMHEEMENGGVLGDSDQIEMTFHVESTGGDNTGDEDDDMGDDGEDDEDEDTSEDGTALMSLADMDVEDHDETGLGDEYNDDMVDEEEDDEYNENRVIESRISFERSSTEGNNSLQHPLLLRPGRGPGDGRCTDDGKPQAGGQAAAITQAVEEHFMSQLLSVAPSSTSVERNSLNSESLANDNQRVQIPTLSRELPATDDLASNHQVNTDITSITEDADVDMNVVDSEANQGGDAVPSVGVVLEPLSEQNTSIAQDGQAGQSDETGATNTASNANGIDPTFLEALPTDLRAEVLASQQAQSVAAPVSAPAPTPAPSTAEDFDPEFLAALPPDIQA
nr:hypothetical protein [Tanacetum cinerariifolium]